MIQYIGFGYDDEGLSEVPEIELEFVDMPEKNAIVLIPGDKKEKAPEIVSSILALRGVLQTFLTKKRPGYTVHTLHGDDEQKEVCVFPFDTSYENLKREMETVRQAKNLMGDCSRKVVIGILDSI